MIFKYIILALIALLTNVVQDELSQKWSRWFGKVIKRKFWQTWLNPAVSWQNKYKILPKSKFVTFLFSTMFCWITDAWHFLKMVILACAAFATVFAINDLGYNSIAVIPMVAFMVVSWGILYEFFRGIFGVLSDYKKVEK
jgi:hypothetical protein